MSLLEFIRPKKIKVHSQKDFSSCFEFAPLEPGYGVTVGNALRRILLNSLHGYAISAVKISGVKHEFTSVKGVVEDVAEIYLNLKQVRLKKINDIDINEEKINIALSDVSEFRAGMIQEFTSNFEITNPDFLICTIDKSIVFQIELVITFGRGYVPSDEIKSEENMDIEYILLDAIYTPIRNVKYSIDNTRVGDKTDYEKLDIEIQTDGTIDPEFALKESAKILMQHLAIITDENITTETQEEQVIKTIQVDDKLLMVRKLLKTPIEDLDLSVRAFNCLKSSKINYLKDLVKLRKHDLIKFRNFGQKSLTEIEQIVNDRGLQFGMDLSPYNIDENEI